MKKAFLTLFAVVLAAWSATAQTILNFETPATSTTFQYFGSTLEPQLTQTVANPAPGGINTSANVSNFTKPAGAQPWAGAFSNPNPTTPLNVTGGALIKIKVRMPHIGNLAVKLEGSTSGEPDWIKIVPNTQINQWQELTFDCSLPSDEGLNQVPTGTFTKVVLFFNFNVPGGASDVLYHFDDLVVIPGAPTPMHQVTFSVNMSQYTGPTFSTVYLSGTMNNWNGTANPMTNMGGGIWSVTLTLPQGPYQYKFTLDNWAQQESFAPGAPCTITAGGFTNRYLNLTGPMTLTQVCWNSCSVCGTPLPLVTFKVNMSNYTGPAFSTVYLSGSMNSWNGTANPMTNLGGGIWSVTIPLAAGAYEYKFQLDGWAQQENFTPGAPCTVTNFGFTNRAITVAGTMSTIDFCWNSCSTCPTGLQNVAFSVNMSQYSGPAFSTVYVSGTFNSWSGNAHPLTNAGGGIWTGTVAMPAGNHEYKVTLDNWAQQEQFAGVEECTKTTGGFTNRFLSVPSGGMTVPTFCYNSCYQCGEERKMTFRLGMGNVTPNPAGVWLAGGGNFEAPGGRYKMNNVGGIWELVVPRKVGFSSYFTFANGPCADYSCKENLAGFPCGNPGNFNDRFLPAIVNDTIWASCFGQCSNNAQCTYPALGATFAMVGATCPGGSDAKITTTVTGGSTFYTYLWNDGATTKNRQNLTAGTYSVTISDAIAQQSTVKTVVVTQPSVLLSVPTVTNVACFGQATGAISLVTFGGTAGYSYLWAGGATTPTRSGLVPGTYPCVITDSKGCTTSVSPVVTQPAAALDAFSVPVEANCFGQASGSIFLTVSGGTPFYNYSWSNGSGSKDLVNVAAGTYSCTITDQKGCTKTITETINQPASALAVTASATQPTCTAANGSIALAATGGTAGYAFLWANGATTPTRTGLAAGTYSATVTDALGCTKTISQTLAPTNSAIAATAVSTNVACFGAASGTIALTVSNGAGALIFNWSNGATTQNLAGLAAGVFSVTATDANGCTATTSKTISQPAAALAAAATASNIACFGQTTGAVSLAVTGGTTGYSFAWADGPTTQNRSNLAAGAYSATISDANGCETTVSSNVSQPNAALAAAAVASDVACFGGSTGSISLGVSGGTAGYSVAWADGPTTQNRSNLAAGTYSAIVTDANGCSTSIQKAIAQPSAALTATTSASDVLCNGQASGAASVAAAGGTAGYSFLWSNGATTTSVSSLAAGSYGVTVEDAKGCTSATSATIAQPALLELTATATPQTANGSTDGTASATATGGASGYGFLWSNGATTASISGLAPGAYSVVVTDANGCTASQTVTVSPFGCALAATISGANGSCFGANDGSAAVVLAGAAQPVSFLWSNGATTQTVSGLAPGLFSVDVLDAANCPATLSIQISQPAQLAANATATGLTAANSNDGTASANPTGGASGFSFLWSNGATTASISGLAAGDFSVVVTDANGCSASQTVTVAPFGCAISAAFSTQNVSCAGAANGEITASVSGGSANLAFSWSNGATTATISGLAGGSYSVIISDGAACSTSGQATITEPTVLSAAISSQTNVVCPNDASGAATVSATGGTTGYGFLWSSGATTATVSGLLPGVYSVVVTDANGCTATGAATILAVDQVDPVVTCPASITRCAADNTVDYAFPEASDNCPLLNGTWAVVTGLPTGSVFPTGVTKQTFTFTDASGNVGTCSFDITIQSPATVGSLAVTGCFQNCEGSITASGTTGGTAPYAYNWSNGATGLSVTGLCATALSLVVVDAANCSTPQIINLPQPPALVLSAPTVVNDANGQNIGSISIAPTGGVAPYSFKWTKNGAAFSTSEDLTGLGAGDYSVVVTDLNGCTVSVQNIVVTNTVAVSEPDWARGMQLVPNPTDGFVQLVFAQKLPGEIVVSAFDAAGRLVFSTVSKGENVIDLDFSSLPAGVYSVRMRAEKGASARVLVVQR